MHPEAMQYVNRHAHGEPVTVVEIGSLDINGTVRGLFPGAVWHGIDVVDGPAVDEVADGATWQPEAPVDLVVSCEVFEHTEDWRAIIANAFAMLRPLGEIVVTAAGPDRFPHSAVDGGELRPGEYYANISVDELTDALVAAGFVDVDVELHIADVRGYARRPGEPTKKRSRQS